MLIEDLVQILAIGDPGGARKVALYRQLSQAIRSAVLAGHIGAGVRLPASRYLARALSMSRATVVNAYEQLQAEGIVESRKGDGTYVCDIIATTASIGRMKKETPDHRELFSRRAGPLVQPGTLIDSRNHPLFLPGLADLSLFPDRYWKTISNRYAHQHLGYTLFKGNLGGYQGLREEIAAHLRIGRGIQCDADQVIIMSGIQHATRFIFSLLCDAGDAVAIEDPCYPGAVSSALMSELEVQALPLDEQGACLPVAGPGAMAPKIIYLTPSHQFPMGINMPLARRVQMIEFAHENNAWIIEDDYDNEFPLRTKPVTAMKGLDIHERIIYAGTFSKVLANYIKISYLVVPRALKEAFRVASRHLALEMPLNTQAIIADYMAQGYYHRHVRLMRARYAKKQTLMRELVDQSFRGIGVRSGGDSGLHAVLELPLDMDDQKICFAASERGLGCRPLSEFCLVEKKRGLILGFAYGGAAELTAGVEVLAQLVKQAASPQGKSHKLVL